MSYYKVSGIKISEKNINTKIAINNVHPIEYENYKVENNIIKVTYILRLLERGDFQFNDKFSSIEKIAFLLTLKKFYKKRRKTNYKLSIKDAEIFYKTLSRLKKIKEKNNKYIIVFKDEYIRKVNKHTYNYNLSIENANKFKLEEALNIKLLNWYKDCRLIEVKNDN